MGLILLGIIIGLIGVFVMIVGKDEIIVAIVGAWGAIIGGVFFLVGFASVALG